MDTAMQALSDRVAEIERRLNIRTDMCAGYCEQPTSDPGGMCQACRERERQEEREAFWQKVGAVREGK